MLSLINLINILEYSLLFFKFHILYTEKKILLHYFFLSALFTLDMSKIYIALYKNKFFEFFSRTLILKNIISKSQHAGDFLNSHRG